MTHDRDYGELVFSRLLAPPPAILYLRQEPYPPERTAEILLELLAQPHNVDGFFLVIGEQSVRRRRLPEAQI